MAVQDWNCPVWMRCAETGESMEELFSLRPGRYRHFKGNEYELLYVARHSETLEPMVVYRALYGERGVWVRPAAMWSEPVDRDGYHGPRFQWIGGVSEEV